MLYYVIHKKAKVDSDLLSVAVLNGQLEVVQWLVDVANVDPNAIIGGGQIRSCVDLALSGSHTTFPDAITRFLILFNSCYYSY